MPTPAPTSTEATADRLKQLGQQLLRQRKALRISAVAAAEAAGLSRVTLHRIEKGEPSVTMGAYLNVAHALGLQLTLGTAQHPPPGTEPSIPVRIELARYPQLAGLAWQVHGEGHITPVEALDIYERNARHLDPASMDAAERALLDGLRAALGGARRDV